MPLVRRVGQAAPVGPLRRVGQAAPVGPLSQPAVAAPAESGQDGQVSRAAVVMTAEEIEELLASAKVAVLATIGPDGVPDPVPMWFVLRDGQVWMRTYAKSQKVHNLRRDPRVSVLVEDGSRYAELRGVQFTGRIDLHDDVDLICGIVADLMVKYEGLDPEHRAGVIDAYRLTAVKQVAMQLVVERTASWDHSKIVPGS